MQYQNRIGAYAIIERNIDNKIAIASDDKEVYFFLGGGMEKGEQIMREDLIYSTTTRTVGKKTMLIILN